MKILILAIAFSLIGIILGYESCIMSNSIGKNIKSFEGCKAYSTYSEKKLCCYVHGKDKNENSISACNELTGILDEALAELYILESAVPPDDREYFLEADCNFGQTLSLCDPNDRISESPLSIHECAKYPVVTLVGGVERSSKCCYVTGTNANKKNMYSCVKVEEILFPVDEMKKDIENGKYRRLGALTNVHIECYSGKFYPLLIISLIFALLNFL